MNVEQLRNAIWEIDEKFVAEAETYEPETRSNKSIWIITSASAAVIALCTCMHFHNEAEHARYPEIDNSIVMTTTISETELYETDVIKTENVAPVNEHTEVSETEAGYESSIRYTVTVSAEKESPPSPSDVNEHTEAYPITEPHIISEIPVTEKTQQEKIITLQSGDRECLTDSANTPEPSSSPVSEKEKLTLPSESDPVLSVNSENNTFDNAKFFGMAYSKRGVYVFDESRLNNNTMNAEFISIAENTVLIAKVKTISGISNEELLLVKCGNTAGKYYVFLNDSLSEEDVNRIFQATGITEIPTSAPVTSPETEQSVPTPET